MAFAVRAVVRGLAAVTERRKIARIAARPTAGAWGQIDYGEPPVDRFLIGEISGEHRAAVDDNLPYVSICVVHFVLWIVREACSEARLYAGARMGVR